MIANAVDLQPDWAARHGPCATRVLPLPICAHAFAAPAPGSGARLWEVAGFHSEDLAIEDNACVWVQAASAEEPVEIAAKRLSHMGAWRTGPDVDQEVFAAEEYRRHAKPGDYTRSVIIASRAS